MLLATFLTPTGYISSQEEMHNSPPFNATLSLSGPAQCLYSSWGYNSAEWILVDSGIAVSADGVYG